MGKHDEEEEEFTLIELIQIYGNMRALSSNDKLDEACKHLEELITKMVTDITIDD